MNYILVKAGSTKQMPLLLMAKEILSSIHLFFAVLIQGTRLQREMLFVLPQIFAMNIAVLFYPSLR